MTSEWEILALGLLLGIRHAFDPDHLVAVTTIVSEYRNPLKGIWIGVSWGLGHTTTLFLAGVALLLLHLQIPDRLAMFFEFAVGLMLIVLGVQTFLSLRQQKVHVHSHTHDDETGSHEHFHSHEGKPEHDHQHVSTFEKWTKLLIAGVLPGDHDARGTKAAIKPFFRLKSYVVGTVHGMAGSAALMLLVLATIKSAWEGVTYIIIFGLGTVVSMGLISIFISMPFSVSGRMPRLNRVVQAGAGTFSIAFGLFLAYQIGITGGLFGI